MKRTQYKLPVLLQLGLALALLSELKSSALAQSGPNSAGSKPAASVAAKPLTDRELAKLTGEDMQPSQRDGLRRLLQKFPSLCGKPHSLLTSLKSDPQCRISVVAARWLGKLFAEDNLIEEIEGRYLRRFGGTKCTPIDVSGAQVRGDRNAPISLIEFSDFECPHCSLAEPIIGQVLAEFKNIKLVFMNYPQAMHRNAATAAAAALAAGRQDKFWPYHDKLFANSDKLQLVKLVQYARELSLDVPRFQRDLEALRSRVAHEREIGEKLTLPGTPTFFVGCQRVEEALSVETIRSYIEAEMAR